MNRVWFAVLCFAAIAVVTVWLDAGFKMTGGNF